VLGESAYQQALAEGATLTPSAVLVDARSTLKAATSGRGSQSIHAALLPSDM